MTVLTALVIRPDPACHELVCLLNQAGIKAFGAPLLSFTYGKDLPLLSDILSELPTNSIVVAVSPRAVEYTSKQMEAQGNNWRQDLRYIAVGQKTAEIWQTLCGIKANVPTQETSEGLLAMKAFSPSKGLHVVILRGNNGRMLLGDAMTEHGAQIRYVETYQQHWNVESLPSLAEQWRMEGVNTLIVTSSEQLSSLCQTIPIKDLQWLRECHILVPSKRIYNQAISLCFKTINCVNSASNHSLFHALHKMHKKMHKSGQSDDKQE